MALNSEGNKTNLLARSSVPIVCKVIELCLTIIIVGLIVDPTNNGVLGFDQNHSGIVYVSWPGYILINTIFILGHLIGDRIPKRTHMLFSFVGGVLFVVASGVAIEDWRRNRLSIMRHTSKQYQDMTISAGALGLLTAVFFFVETVAVGLYGEDEE